MGIGDLVPYAGDLRQGQTGQALTKPLPAVVQKQERKKAKAKADEEFRSGVWLRDKRRSRASQKPVSPSGTDYDRVGEVHHVIPRSLAPERVWDVANGLLLTKAEHALAETNCPNDPAKRLLDIVGPDDRALPQCFIWHDVQGKEIRRRAESGWQPS